MNDRIRFLVHLYTSPLRLVTLSSWGCRADYIERLTRDEASGDLVGDRVYRLLYGRSTRTRRASVPGYDRGTPA